MPPIGNQDGTLVYPSWSNPVYARQIPKWPHPNTPRVDGRLRWLSDPNLYPVGTKYLATLSYRDTLGVLESQYYWFDIAHDTGLRFVASSGLSAFGKGFDFSIEYFDTLPHLGVPGVRQDFSYFAPGDPPATRAFEWSNADTGYPLNYVAGLPPPTWVDPPTFSSTYGGTYPAKDVNLLPIAECFPGDQFTTTGGAGMPINGAWIYPNASQSVNALVAIPFQIARYDTDSFWSGANPTRLTVPSGFTEARLFGGLQVTSGGTDGFMFFRRNGVNDWLVAPQPLGTTSGGSAVGVMSTPWFPVSATDYFELMAAKTSAATVTPYERQYFAIEAH